MAPLFGSLASSGAIQLLNIVSGVILARILGTDDRGELAAVILWPTVLSIIGSLGLFQATAFHTARRENPVGTIVGTTLALALALSALLVAVGFPLMALALDGFGAEAVGSARINLAYIPLSLCALSLMAVLNGLEHRRAFQFLRVLVALLAVLIIVGLAAADDLTPRSAVVAYLVANLLTLVAAAWLLSRVTVQLRFGRHVARKLLAFGVSSHLSDVPAFLGNRLDQLVVSVFLSPASLGLYVIAVTTASATSLVGISAFLVALPAVARLAPGRRRTTTARFYVSATLVGSILVSLPIVAFSPQLIELFFGEAFLGAADASRILVVGAVVFSLNRTLAAVAQGIDRPLDAGIGETIALVATAVALAALLPALDLAGAAIASLLGFMISAVFMTRRMANAFGVSPAGLLLPPRGWLRKSSLRTAMSLGSPTAASEPLEREEDLAADAVQRSQP